MTKHKHAEVIKAWADGAVIEWGFGGNEWSPLNTSEPRFDEILSYRVKRDEPDMIQDIKIAYDVNTAPEFLHRAATIMEERGKQYDKPGGERSMGKTVAAFNAITGRDLSEAEGWLLLETLKNVRQWQNPGFHQDSADDGVAYSALKSEAKAKEASHVQA